MKVEPGVYSVMVPAPVVVVVVVVEPAPLVVVVFSVVVVDCATAVVAAKTSARRDVVSFIGLDLGLGLVPVCPLDRNQFHRWFH